MSLNKQRVIEGMFCQRALWLRANRPDLHPTPDGFAQLLMERGSEAGRHARFDFPDGQLIPLGLNMVQDTALAIEAGATTLFEASFEHEGIVIRTDILTRLPNGRWHLIEAKGTSRVVKDEHPIDVAVQLHVLQAAGIDVGQVSLMHLNNQADYADRGDWFVVEDISAEVLPLLPAVATAAPLLLPVLQQKTEPIVQLGTHCRKCDFQPHCWQHLGDKCVYGIPRLSGKKLAAVQALGIEHLDDLPDDFPLTATQRSYVDALYAPNPVRQIDRPAIQNALSELTYPIYFFDFEADQPFLPIHPNSSPFSRIPYQFSCHILQADGTLTHTDYLHTDESDPRPHITQALCDALGESGSIVVYHATFERTVLLELARRLPQFAEQIDAIIERLWDQLVIFRKHYYDPAFKGSNSLKSVLPVLAPHLDYAQEAVSDGTASVSGWQRLITLPAGAERDQLTADLNSYCRLDTFAMVEIHRVLSAL